MNDSDRKLLEVELRRLKPAAPPAEFLARLAAAPPAPQPPAIAQSRPAQRAIGLRILLRWLATATAAVAVALLLAWPSATPPPRPAHLPALAALAPLQADDVEIDHRLVSAFDAVARLPDGVPVRLRCREWVDNVVLRDSAQGVEVEQRTPQLEIIPVRLETY